MGSIGVYLKTFARDFGRLDLFQVYSPNGNRCEGIPHSPSMEFQRFLPSFALFVNLSFGTMYIVEFQRQTGLPVCIGHTFPIRGLQQNSGTPLVRRATIDQCKP